MQTQTRLLYGHAWLARAGLSWTTPSSGGPVSNTAKPPVDAADASADDLWVALGAATSQITTALGIRKEIWTGAPGQLIRKDIVAGKKTLEWQFTCQELSDLAIQLIFGTADLGLDSSATAVQFNQLEGSSLLKGWLKQQCYDEQNNKVFYIDQWCAIEFDGALALDGEGNEYTFKISDLYSTYNTGVLAPTS